MLRASVGINPALKGAQCSSIYSTLPPSGAGVVTSWRRRTATHCKVALHRCCRHSRPGRCTPAHSLCTGRCRTQTRRRHDILSTRTDNVTSTLIFESDTSTSTYIVHIRVVTRVSWYTAKTQELLGNGSCISWTICKQADLSPRCISK